MKNLRALALTLSFLLAAVPVIAADHVLTVDGVEHEVTLGIEQRIPLQDGNQILVLLKRKAFATFARNGVTFEHPAQVQIASSKPDDGMTQHIAVSALGTLLLFQHHDQIDVNSLLDVLFDKMMEEPRALKLTVDKAPLTRTIADGKVLTGLTGHYAKGDDDVTIDIAIYPRARGGEVFLTMWDKHSAPDEKAIVEQFWNTLKIQ